jgi:hypothetical protein
VPATLRYGMDEPAAAPHHAPVRVLPHIKRLDDAFGPFLVRVVCDCGACREIEPEALAHLVGWKKTLKELALRMRCSELREEGCGGGRGGAPEAARARILATQVSHARRSRPAGIDRRWRGGG